jgi:hypothetical protein
MTCRHAPGDPACSSSPAGQAREAARRQAESQRNKDRTIGDLKNTSDNLQAQLNQGRIDAENAEIVDMHRVGRHVAIKVQYPSCKKCSYEGFKVMVYLNVSEVQMIRWRVFDPHFQDPETAKQSATEAPSPAARFPASAEGWQDAIEYARSKADDGK